MYKLILFLTFFQCAAQAQAFKEDIAAFKKQDSLNFPPANAILFIGSSSFTNWVNVQDYFPSQRIINRGFGGSSLTDLITYEKDIIFPYKPAQIVIYCGENDLAGDSLVTGQMVFERFKKLFYDIRSRYPATSIVYISMKPSPSRFHLIDKFKVGNALIKKFLKQQKKSIFVDVFKKMITKKGKPKEELFLEDQLHMNNRGYDIWASLIRPHLIKKSKRYE